MTKALSEVSFRWLVVTAICLAGLIAYANTFANDFVWDDASSVLLHKHVQDPSRFFQLFREDQHAFGRGQGNFYRPLVAASFMLDFALSTVGLEKAKPEARIPEVSTFFFHLTNILWHVAAALLFFALLTRLGAPRFVRCAAPLVYVVHPLHTEAVTYISGRADSMSAVFIFAALWFAMWGEKRGRRAAGAALSCVCFCGGLLSKESSTIFPFLLLLLLLLRPVEDPGKKKEVYVARLVPFGLSLVILGVYAVLRMTVLHFGSSATPGTSLAQRLMETGQALASYFRLLLVPTGLHMERTLEGVPRWTALAGAALLLACVALLVVSLRRKQYRAALGLGWFLLAWLPISGVFPLNAPMAEHWMYVPMAGLFWAAGELVWPYLKRGWGRWPAVAAVYLLCLLFLALTVDRNQDWRDNETMYRTTLRENPRSMRIHYNLAVTHEDLLGNLPGARRHYEQVIGLCRAKRKAEHKTNGAVALWDQELEAHLSLGDILQQQNEYDKAAAHYQAVMQVTPDETHRPLIATAAFGMGKCFLAIGDATRAIEFFNRAVAGRPDLGSEAARLLGRGALISSL